MRTIVFGVLAGFAAATPPLAAATTVTAAAPVTITVDTPAHGFHPQVIRMPGNRPVRLLLRNPSGSGHDFDAPGFFAAAEIDDADRGLLHDGKVELPRYSTVSIRLIARPGHYDLRSDKALDLASGMEGQILVF
jgi:hypothetical protein